MIKVFIDGREGTTGLRIADRLAARGDIELLSIPDELRKDPAARAQRINDSDVTFLCLPDAAAIEAVGLVKNPSTRIIDASTAHRTAEGWVYGLPEIDDEVYRALPSARRVAVPGCHAGGFVLLVRPLVKEGIISPSALLSTFSLTGYSGGGKKMIAEYEDENRSPLLSAPRQYGLTQAHKHLREMTAITGLSVPPIFSPIVCDFYSGMEVSVPLFCEVTGMSADELRDFYREYYAGKTLVYVADKGDERFGGFLPATQMSGRDDAVIVVSGGGERAVATVLFDNLGKGASGAAIQNMNLMFGLGESEGLTTGE